MTDDLVPWLLEQIAEDERVAAANAVDLWPGETLRKVAENKDTHYAWQPHGVSPPRIAHILRFGPRRALAECDAKRRIIDLVDLEFFEGRPQFLGGYGEAYWDTVRLLALAYADRPRYQEAWRP